MYALVLLTAVAASSEPSRKRAIEEALAELPAEVSPCKKALKMHSEYYYSGFYNPTQGDVMNVAIDRLDDTDESFIINQTADLIPHLSTLEVSRDKYFSLFQKCVDLYLLRNPPSQFFEDSLAEVLASRENVAEIFAEFVSTPATQESRLRLFGAVLGERLNPGLMMQELNLLLLIQYSDFMPDNPKTSYY